MSRFEEASAYITGRMEKELTPMFRYHNLSHVLDVLNAAEAIAEAEKVNQADLELLRIAALFHDSGFMVNPENHEAMGCEIAREFLPGVGYNDSELEIICSMIMATKIPQTPRTHLEEIICDADLDYLGRDDFYTTGNKVFLELVDRGKMTNEHEWNRLQVQFLSSHNYFTNTSRTLRKHVKEKHLAEVLEIVAGY